MDEGTRKTWLSFEKDPPNRLNIVQLTKNVRRKYTQAVGFPVCRQGLNERACPVKHRWYIRCGSAVKINVSSIEYSIDSFRLRAASSASPGNGKETVKAPQRRY